MKNTRSLFQKVIPIGIFSLLVLILTSCGFQPLSFDAVDHIEVKDIQDNVGTLILTITATNPNKKPVVIHDLSAQIGINTVDVGTVSQSEKFEIPPNGTHTMQVPFTLTLENNILTIAAGLSLAIFTDNLEVKINGNATGQYGKIKVPIPISYNDKISTTEVKGLWE